MNVEGRKKLGAYGMQRKTDFHTESEKGAAQQSKKRL